MLHSLDILATVTRFAVAYGIKAPFTMVESQAGSVVHNAWYDVKHLLH